MSGELHCYLMGMDVPLRFKALRSGWERIKGLLGTRSDAGPVALCGCSSVHTWGMKYPIDVALVAQNGVVVASERGVAPGRVVTAYGAYYALERPQAPQPWPAVKTWVRMEDSFDSLRGDKEEGSRP